MAWGRRVIIDQVDEERPRAKNSSSSDVSFTKLRTGRGWGATYIIDGHGQTHSIKSGESVEEAMQRVAKSLR